MYAKSFILIFGCCLSLYVQPSFLDTFKGIGTSIEKFPLFQGSTYKGMASSFGAPPTGYVYSCSVYNDTPLPVYIGFQQLVSMMGGCFPKADGWSLVTIQPFQHHSIMNKPYYFEMLIKATPREPSNHMPYLQHADALYQQDNILLQMPHSTQHNYFRSFIGKNLQNGTWQYCLKAESLGFSDPAAKNGNGGVSLSSNLTSLTIKNSTSKDFYIGYVNQPNVTALSARSCQLFVKIEANSFALYNAAQNNSLRPGTIGLFDASTQQLLQTYALEDTGFNNMPYTLEIAYIPLHNINVPSASSTHSTPSAGSSIASGIKEGLVGTAEVVASTAMFALGARGGVSFSSGGRKNQSSSNQSGLTLSGKADNLAMFMQGVTPGNYDLPISRVRDITPIQCVFWYQAAAGQKGLMDLPGAVWTVVYDPSQQTMISCVPGKAVSFYITRPEVDKKLWIYFVYVDSADNVKSAQFIKNFLNGTIGKDVIAKFEHESEKQMARAEQSATEFKQVAKNAKQTAAGPSEKMLAEAVEGALQLNQGQISDASTGITGYLIGCDVFLSMGVGSTTMYYILAPSWSTPSKKPTSSVQNLYASTLSGQAPDGMPEPVAQSTNALAKVVTKQVVAPKISMVQKASNWVKSKISSITSSSATASTSSAVAAKAAVTPVAAVTSKVVVPVAGNAKTALASKVVATNVKVMPVTK